MPLTVSCETCGLSLPHEVGHCLVELIRQRDTALARVKELLEQVTSLYADLRKCEVKRGDALAALKETEVQRDDARKLQDAADDKRRQWQHEASESMRHWTAWESRAKKAEAELATMHSPECSRNESSKPAPSDAKFEASVNELLMVLLGAVGGDRNYEHFKSRSFVADYLIYLSKASPTFCKAREQVREQYTHRQLRQPADE